MEKMTIPGTIYDAVVIIIYQFHASK